MRNERKKGWIKTNGEIFICFPVALAADFLIGVYFMDYDKDFDKGL